MAILNTKMSLEEYKKLVLKNECVKKDIRQLLGKINREKGREFEKQIELICDLYKKNNIAIIEKTPEPMKILRHISDGTFETVFEKSAQPDFKGTLNGGKTVVFDAKFTNADKISYHVLSEHQRETLLEYDKMGANAFVLVGFGNGDMYRIDINDWNNMKAIFGNKHIKQEQLSDRKLKKMKNGLINFLN